MKRAALFTLVAVLGGVAGGLFGLVASWWRQDWWVPPPVS